MSKPRFGPHVQVTIERNGEVICATLSQDSALPGDLRYSEFAASEGLALRKVAQAAVAARITDKWAPTADELLERMTEADRVKLAPHLRQSAQDIAEMMAATVGRIDALMAPPVVENPDDSLAGHLAHHMASQYINVERECLQDARFALSCADDANTMTREQFVDLFNNLRRVLGVK